MSKRTKQYFIIVSGALICSAGAFGFMLYRVQTQTSTLSMQLATLSHEQESLLSDSQLQRVAAKTAEMRGLVRSQFLQDENDSIAFLTTVERDAAKMGVNVRTSGLQLITEKGSREQWVEARFECEGTQPTVLRFLAVLETMPYVTRITSVDFRSAGVLWKAAITVRVRVFAYDS